MLPSFAIDVGVDDEGILIDLGAIGRYVPLLGAIRKSHDILEEFLLSVHLRFSQVLPNQIQQGARFLPALLLAVLLPLLPAAARVPRSARSVHRFRHLLFVLPRTPAVQLATRGVKGKLNARTFPLGTHLQLFVSLMLAPLA